MRVWRFSLYYFLVFGGYVALSLWLPKYYIDVFGLPLKDGGAAHRHLRLPVGHHPRARAAGSPTATARGR